MHINHNLLFARLLLSSSHFSLFIIHHTLSECHTSLVSLVGSLELAQLAESYFFYLGSFFHFVPLARYFFLLMLFNLFRRLFGQLCFLNCSFLIVLFDQFCFFNDFLLKFLPNQLYLLEALSCQYFLVFLESFLVSITF